MAHRYAQDLGGFFPSSCPHPDCLDWARKYFGDCVCSERDKVSFAIGLASLVFWAFAEIPQIATNFFTGSAEGISTSFVLLWSVGDVFNLVGCLLNPFTLPAQIYIAILYLTTTLVLVFQSFYYRWSNRKRRVRVASDDVEAPYPGDPSQPLLADDDLWKSTSLPPMPGDSPTAFMDAPPSAPAAALFQPQFEFGLPSTPVTRHIDGSDKTYIISARSLVAITKPVAGAYLPQFPALLRSASNVAAQAHVIPQPSPFSEPVRTQGFDISSATILLSPKDPQPENAPLTTESLKIRSTPASPKASSSGLASVAERNESEAGVEKRLKGTVEANSSLSAETGKGATGVAQTASPRSEAAGMGKVVEEGSVTGLKNSAALSATSSPRGAANAKAVVVEEASGKSPRNSTALSAVAAGTVLFSGVGLVQQLFSRGNGDANGNVGGNRRSLAANLAHVGLQVANKVAMAGQWSHIGAPARFGGALFPFIAGVGAKRGNVGLVLGWFMCAIYMGSRLPQIYLNCHRGHVEGLDPKMFLLALLGNATYIASILVRNSEWSHIIGNLPWLVDAAVCVLLDFFILGQFAYFSYKDDTHYDNDDDEGPENLNPRLQTVKRPVG